MAHKSCRCLLSIFLLLPWLPHSLASLPSSSQGRAQVTGASSYHIQGLILIAHCIWCASSERCSWSFVSRCPSNLLCSVYVLSLLFALSLCIYFLSSLFSMPAFPFLAHPFLSLLFLIFIIFIIIMFWFSLFITSNKKTLPLFF